jgi:ribulose-phosphate 3-epimerase
MGKFDDEEREHYNLYMISIAPSLLSANFAILGEEVAKVTDAGADYIHFDVMDGQFVPNITFGPMILSAIRPFSSLPFEAHLMIVDPVQYWKIFADAGADIIGFHIEQDFDHLALSREIQKAGKKSCVVINPPTELHLLDPLLPVVDQILVMTVNPGFGGQKFIHDGLQKIEHLAERREKQRYSYLIEVDGGINVETAKLASSAGADILVAGSFIFGSKDYQDTIRRLRCG